MAVDINVHCNSISEIHGPFPNLQSLVISENKLLKTVTMIPEHTRIQCGQEKFDVEICNKETLGGQEATTVVHFKNLHCTQIFKEDFNYFISLLDNLSTSRRIGLK